MAFKIVSSGIKKQGEFGEIRANVVIELDGEKYYLTNSYKEN